MFHLRHFPYLALRTMQGFCFGGAEAEPPTGVAESWWPAIGSDGNRRRTCVRHGQTRLWVVAMVSGSTFDMS